jgi:hypothetical protein
MRKPAARRAADIAARVRAEARAALCPPLDVARPVAGRALLCEFVPFLAQQARRGGGGGGGWAARPPDPAGSAAAALSQAQRAWLGRVSGPAAFAGLAPGARLRSGFGGFGGGALRPGDDGADSDSEGPGAAAELRPRPPPEAGATAAGSFGGSAAAVAAAGGAARAARPDTADPIDDFSD